MIDIIIIGGGAAGMTAALYALRSKKKVLVIEKESFGGQIASSPRVENFPSIKEISGLDFSDNLFNQIMDLGALFEIEDVERIEKKGDVFEVKTNYNTYTSRCCIIATGVKHKTLKAQNYETFEKKGISYCAVCDGSFYEGKDVCVIGDANSALQYSLMLSNICNKVYLCTLFDKFFGDKTLVERIYEKNNISIIQNVSLTSYMGLDTLTGLTFKNLKTNDEVMINVDGVFIAIGQVPNNDNFKNVVDLDNDGYIITDENLETKTVGLYAVGDCRVKKIRQLTTATADGAIAAVNICNFIDKLF